MKLQTNKPFNQICFKSFWKPLLSSSLLLSLIFSAIQPNAVAEKTLKNMKQPITVQLQVPLSLDETNVGQEFKGILTENYKYEGNTLPAGTVFNGKVMDLGESRRYLRPGYVAVDVHEAVLPSGDRVSLHPGDNLHEEDVHNKDAVTVKQYFMAGVPFAAISTAISVPLDVATNFGSGVIIPITMAAKMATGAVIELKRDDSRWRKTSAKVAYGLYRGTGSPAIIHMFHKAPEPNYQPGDNISMQLDPEGLNALFIANEADGADAN